MYAIRHNSKERTRRPFYGIQDLAPGAVHGVELIPPSLQYRKGLLFAPVRGDGGNRCGAFDLCGLCEAGYGACGPRDLELAFERNGDFGKTVENRFRQVAYGGLGTAVVPDLRGELAVFKVVLKTRL